MSKLSESEIHSLILAAEKGVALYLDHELASGRLAKNYFDDARATVIPKLKEWLTDDHLDRLSPKLKSGIKDTIETEKWQSLVNAFVREVKFGTGGIRALMAYDRKSIERLKEEGIDARILKGPNTINNIVVMKAAYGVARYFVDNPHEDRPSPPKGVVGFDSRVRGGDFAELVAGVFLAEGVEVYLFDEAVPYPEVTFAIPNLNADFGVFISASHNDYRYNGFKMSGPHGAQIAPRIRNKILNEYIRHATTDRLNPIEIGSASPESLARLSFLGGNVKLSGKNYHDRPLIDMHSMHVAQVEKFAARDRHDAAHGSLRIVYSAFNGSGRRAVPRLLENDLRLGRVHSISRLDPLDGLFPAFESEDGKEQQPDPGDPRAAEIALFELGKDSSLPGFIPWADADLLIGTDPDADRCGVAVHPPRSLQLAIDRFPMLSIRYKRDSVLVPADDMWALLVWDRLTNGVTRGDIKPDEMFVALSHTTSDMIAAVARSFGLGILKTWVGFGWLSAGVAEAWKGEGLPVIKHGCSDDSPGSELGYPQSDLVFFDTSEMRRSHQFNVATLEQSNGFSILGGPPPGYPRRDYAMGLGGHVRDKDGTFAAVLITDMIERVQTHGTDILTMLAEKLYADPRIGLYVNYYEPDPFDGEYPGLEGDSKKKAILDRAMNLRVQAQAGDLVFGGRPVSDSEVYWTGKYDEVNWRGFPDEGIRFYFNSRLDHLTIRPSGTTNALRFHVQLFHGEIAPSDAWLTRLQLETNAQLIVTEARQLVGALRAPEVRL